MRICNILLCYNFIFKGGAVQKESILFNFIEYFKYFFNNLVTEKNTFQSECILYDLNYLHLLRHALWPRIWVILSLLEKNVYFAFG